MTVGLGALVGMESFLLSEVVYVRLGERGFGLDFAEEHGERADLVEMRKQCEGARSEDREWLCSYLSSLSNGGLTLQVLLALSLILSVLSLVHSVLTPYCVNRMARGLIGGQLAPCVFCWPRCLTLCQSLSLLNPVVAIAAIVLYPVVSRFPEISQTFSLHAETGLAVLAVEAGVRLLLYGWMIAEIVENRRKNSRLLEEEGTRQQARTGKSSSDDTLKVIHPAASIDDSVKAINPAVSADETRL